VREAEQALHELVAPAGRVVDIRIEGVEPAVESRGDVAEELARDDRAAHEEREAEGDPAQSPRGDVDHDEEEAEVQQRGAEVALDDEDPHGRRPDDEDRSEVACAGEAHPEEPPADHREAVPSLDEVSGEEDRERDLGELARLEREHPETDPESRAELLVPDDGEHGQEKEHDAGEHGDVAVALQDPMVANEHDDGDGDRHRDGRPGDLADAVGLPAGAAGGEIQAVDLGDAEPVEQGRDRQDERVGIRGDEAQRHVHPDREHGQAAAEPDDLGADLAERSQLHEHDGDPVEHARDEQEQELEVAQAGRHAKAQAQSPAPPRCRARRGGGGGGLGRRVTHRRPGPASR
jgi:hypothetical protein